MKSDRAVCLSVLMLFCITVSRAMQQLCPVTALCWHWFHVHEVFSTCYWKFFAPTDRVQHVKPANIIHSRLATPLCVRQHQEKVALQKKESCKPRASARQPATPPIMNTVPQHPHKRSRAGLGTVTTVNKSLVTARESQLMFEFQPQQSAFRISEDLGIK